jgi:hypothetical protein
MHRSSRVRTFLVALFIAASAGAAWSQQWEPRWEAELYGAFVEGFAAREGLAREIADAAREGARVDAEVVMEEICAMQLGTGGNPRIDGGGGTARIDGGGGTARMDGGGGTLLAPFPSAGSALWPYARVSAHEVAFPPTGGLQPPAVRMAVIDAFATGAFGVATDRGAATGGGAPLSVAALWDELVGRLLQGHATDAVPHGNLVLFHLLAQWAGQGGLHVRASGDEERPVLHVSAPGRSDVAEVHLLDVDYADVSSIRQAMEAARELGDVVVVASWGLVDCVVAAGYQAAAPAPISFAAYVDAVLGRSGTSAVLLESLCRAFAPEIARVVGYANCESDDFLRWISRLLTVAAVAETDRRARLAVEWDGGGDDGLVVFASAGNQGLPFPMPPAAWPGVVGVEACVSGVLHHRATFSNAASTMKDGAFGARALGGWFATPVLDARGGPLGYWGTSFAAPAAAAAFAGQRWDLDALEVVAPCGQALR